MSEALVKSQVLLAVGRRPDLMAWNNPTGVARSMDGKRVIRFGVNGSGDVLGVLAVTVTRDMVGTVIGQAVSIETKRGKDGKQRQSQKDFERAFAAHGGRYILGNSVEQVLKGLPE